MTPDSAKNIVGKLADPPKPPPVTAEVQAYRKNGKAKPDICIYTRVEAYIDGPSKFNWGDYWVQDKLTEAFAFLQHEVVTQPPAPIHLFCWGRRPVKPIPNCGKRIAWFYSRPEQMTLAELRRYDLVFCTSESYTEEMKDKAPIVHLPVCSHLFGRADPVTIDCPDVVFIGNARKNKGGRPIAKFLSAQKTLPFSFGIWGVGWEGNPYWQGRYHPFDRLQDLYYSSKAVLIDHYPEMAAQGFLKHQVLDVIAAGGLPVVDRVDIAVGDRIWPEYHSHEECLDLLASFTDSDPAVEARRRKVIQQAVIPATFIDRALEMMNEIDRRAA